MFGVFLSRQNVEPSSELELLRGRKGGKVSEYLGIQRCPEALGDFLRVVTQV